MTGNNEVFILSGARTPFATWRHGTRGDGKKGGILDGNDPMDLGTAALKGALTKGGVPPEKVNRLVFANTYQIGPHACYGTRYLARRAGFPVETLGPTVNLACGAGLQAMTSAADEIMLGRADLCAAVGADCPSMVARDIMILSFTDISCGGKPVASTSEKLADEMGLSIEDQNRLALRSHERALAAKKRGVFAEEIVPVGEAVEDDVVLLEPTMEHFEESRPIYREGRSTHANTHAIVDGGAALILASSRGAAGRKPLGRYLGGLSIGVEPERMAMGSVAAIRALLSQLHLDLKKVDLFEINETFASQMLIAFKELALPPEKVNVNGGAISMGHAFAGTGGRLALTLLLELKRRGLKTGVASICIGAGQGIAVAVEAL